MTRTRAPAVAGLFYPSRPTQLEELLRKLLGDESSPARPARFMMTPHAGYVYSGKVAGEAFAQVKVPDSVVVLGPNHTGAGVPHSIYSSGEFSIPGAKVPVDEQLARQLAETMGLRDDVSAHAEEHSIEVQLPFLVKRNPNVKIVPICLGNLSYRQCVKMGHGLAEVLRHRDNVLVLVSSDMSHYVSAREAERLDSMALERMKAVDSRGLYHVVTTERISMCGFLPATVATVAAERLGVRDPHLVSYANSGDVSGDYERVVGYASMVLN